jgi:hypothetical protein
MMNVAHILLISAAVFAGDGEPFWKSKEKTYKRVEQGEVIVVVKREDGLALKAKNRLRIQGGGITHAPDGFVFKKAMDFDKIAKESGYISAARYDAATQKLDLDIHAFGHKATMKLKLSPHENAEPKRIAYEVLEGQLKGMTGVFTFRDLNGKKTEVGIDGDFHYDKLSLPTFFVEFGFEVVFQRMAINLRSFVEREYRKEVRP